MIEIWKDIKGYEGFYMVSNLGRVKSIDRTIKNGNKFLNIKGKVLKPGKNSCGYLQVSLLKNSVAVNHRVHRLVAEAFLERTGLKDCVNHIDYNKSNNCVENLEWVTRSENMIHSTMFGSHKEAYKNNPRKIIVYALVSNSLFRFSSITDAAKCFNVLKSNVSRALKKNLNVRGHKLYNIQENL